MKHPYISRVQLNRTEQNISLDNDNDKYFIQYFRPPAQNTNTKQNIQDRVQDIVEYVTNQHKLCIYLFFFLNDIIFHKIGNPSLQMRLMRIERVYGGGGGCGDTGIRGAGDGDKGGGGRG